MAVGVDKGRVHFVVQTKPSVSPSQVVARVKQLTTRLLWHEHRNILLDLHWGNGKGKLWANGYFYDTVGNVSEGKILEYVENQGVGLH